MSTPTASINAGGYCTQCGNSLPPSTKFCTTCGAENKAEFPAPLPPPPPLSGGLAAGPAGGEVAELERIAAEHPDDESYQKLLAVQLHDDAMKGWWKDPKDGQYLCTSAQQIQYSRRQLSRAAALRFSDSQLRESIERLRKLTERMEIREYTGNWFQVVILGFFGIFPGVIWWFVNRRPLFLINRDYVREIQTGKHPGAGAKMGGAMEKVSNFFDSVTGGWGGWFAIGFMIIFSPIFMILAFKQNYIDVSKEYVTA